MTTFHRFRPIYALLDKYHELENQEIYFASPEQLNDPMEGFKDVYWNGDVIVWENLLKHYVLCLEHVCSLFILGSKTISIRTENIPVIKTEDDLPTPQYKELFMEIWRDFSGNDMIGHCIKDLSKRLRPIRRNELLFYFRSLHLYALDIIFTVYERHGFVNARSDTVSLRQVAEKALSHLPVLLKLTNEVEDEHPSIERGTDILFSAVMHTASQLNLITIYNNPPPDDNNKPFILLGFPEAYIRRIEKLIYSDWYAACFMNQYNNSSVWGNYADNHKGVCLSFKVTTQNDRSFIGLHGIIGRGSSGPILGQSNYEFFKVDYNKKPPEIDFFQSLGTLSRPVLLKHWYTDRNGSRSVSATEIFESDKQWRKRYWEKFYQGITTKLRDWGYEKEYRLILNGFVTDFSNPDRRKFKYNFADLESITFGINTSIEDKLKISNIVEAKCRKENRKDFEFYQAYYSWKSGTIERSKMSLLSFT